MATRKNIAVIGSGVSGLVAAHLLAPHHDITVFEADDRLGGHVNTVDVVLDGATYGIDVGFVVYNRCTYPHFSSLLDRLGVASLPTQMSFSVRSDADDLEYNGRSMSTLFAQPRNMLRPAFLRMLAGILRFNRAARAIAPDCMEPLGAFLRAGGYSWTVQEWYVLPLIGCIWSAPRGRVEDFPVGPLMAFLRNHGLLNLFDRPTWLVIEGGAGRYVDALVRPFRDRIRLRCPVLAVDRNASRVDLALADGSTASFDDAIVAVHGDRVLDLVANPTPPEREAFAPFHYEENSVIVHFDDRLLPRRERARACWNAVLPATDDGKVCVTYDMTLLQHIRAPRRILATLNADDRILPDKILYRVLYRHPVLDADTIAAQRRVESISGQDRIHYCGAYLGYGFHEDGVVSATRVARRFHET